VNDAAPIALNSGMIDYLGRASTASTETLGVVTLGGGLNYITPVPGSTGSAELTLASLSRSTGAILNVAASDSWAGSGTLGTAGNVGRLLVTSALSGNLTAVNNVVPGVFNSGGVDAFNFVSYGAQGFAPVTSSGSLTGAGPTADVSGGGDVTAGGQTINSFNQGGMTFANANDLLAISSGMTMMSGATAWGTASVRGRVTSGTQELFVIKRDGNNGVVNTINSVIVDNGTGPVSAVFTIPRRDGNNFISLTAPNTYSGGTFVSSANGGTLSLDGAAGVVTVPAGGLTINTSSGVTMVTNAGQIHPSNVVTLNGGATLTLVGNNTLAGIAFNNNGGTSAPTVSPTGILTVTGGISSTQANVATVPIISGGTFDLANAAKTVTVSVNPAYAAQTGLTISSVIQSGTVALPGSTPWLGSVTKAGSGVLELSGTNTFVGGLNVNAGAVLATAQQGIGGLSNVSAGSGNERHFGGGQRRHAGERGR